MSESNASRRVSGLLSQPIKSVVLFQSRPRLGLVRTGCRQL